MAKKTTKKPARKRGGLGANPLDAMVPAKGKVTAGAKTAPKTSPKKPVRPKRVRQTVHLDEATLERAKNAAYWTPGLTLARIASEGLAKAVADLEKKHNGGEPFPERAEELVGGRPIGR